MKRVFFSFFMIFFCFSYAVVTADEIQQSKSIPLNPISLYDVNDNDGANVGIRGDVLYMNYSSPFLTYAATLVPTGVPGIKTDKTYEAKGKMSLGFDVNLNYTFKNDPGYTIEANWFYMNPKFHGSVTSDYLYPAHIFLVTTAAAGSGSSRIKMHFNNGDLMLSKQFSFGKYFVFTPSGGPSFLMVKSTYDSVFTSTGDWRAISGHPAFLSEIDINHVYKYMAGGIKFGANFNFDIACGVKIFGNLFYSFLYGREKSILNSTTNATYDATYTPLTGGISTFRHNVGRTFWSSLIGLSWQTTFNDNGQFLDIHAGWRYVNIWQLAAEIEMNDARRDIQLFGQGLEAGITFKF